MTPSELNVRFDDASEDEALINYPYRELIGAFMYLSVGTRRDISNTVSRLAQWTNKLQKRHWLAAKRLLRYLAKTADVGLLYQRTGQHIFGYVDADWGGSAVDRRSYSGYAFLMSGAAVTWKSQKQKTVALSSTEAEYVSLAESAKEALYLRSLLRELDFCKCDLILIYTDNRGAECLAGDPMFHARTKHIDIKYHFIRESISADKLFLKHLPSQEMVADVLTKPLPRVSHERCLVKLGLTDK